LLIPSPPLAKYSRIPYMLFRKILLPREISEFHLYDRVGVVFVQIVDGDFSLHSETLVTLPIYLPYS
jgi:hypothetical protein